MERDHLTSGYWGRPCLPLHAPWQSLRQLPLLRLSRRDSRHCLHIKAYMCKYMPTYHNSSVFDCKPLSVWIFDFLDVSRAQSMGLRSSAYACVFCMHLTCYEPRQSMHFNCPLYKILCTWAMSMRPTSCTLNGHFVDVWNIHMIPFLFESSKRFTLYVMHTHTHCQQVLRGAKLELCIWWLAHGRQARAVAWLLCVCICLCMRVCAWQADIRRS